MTSVGWHGLPDMNDLIDKLCNVSNLAPLFLKVIPSAKAEDKQCSAV